MPQFQNDLSAFGRHAPGGLVARLLAATRRCAPGWLGKRAAFVLRDIAVRALRGRPLDVEALGARMRLYPYNNVCEKRILFTPQFFDPDERKLLATHLSGDFIFIDVGANIGGYTLFAAALAGPRARILAIEPQPEIYERLVYNIRQNGFAQVKAVECALADKDGDVTLFIDPDNRGGTSMRIVAPEGRGGQLRVRARALAALVAEEGFDRIDAIKLDVEGAEDLILEPFFAAAPQAVWPKLLLVENGGEAGESALQKMLVSRGYAITLRTGNKFACERG